jgi:dienelactone hydrolase
MKTVLRLFLFVLLLPSLCFGQKPATQNSGSAPQGKDSFGAQALPPAPPFLSTKICGRGVLVISREAETLGRESFEIQCRPDGGYRASGSTSIKGAGGSLNQETVLELDKEGVPQSLSVKGDAGGTSFEQTTSFKDNKATTIVAGQTQEMPYTDRAPVFVNAVMYLMQFVGARYDTARGGRQEIPLFPDLKATMERTGRDEVSAGNLPAAAARPLAFDRYSMELAGAVTIILWTDTEGRLAALYVPTQKVTAVREEYLSFAEPLRAALISKVKGIVPDYSAPAGATFTAEEVKVPAKGFELAGTLLLPKTGKRPFPAVVMSTGSGQQERDSNFPGFASYRPFRQIAEYLAARGIAVLRADDRGVGSSGGANTLDNVTTFDFADDVRAQISYLRSRPEIDPARIAVIGHSEGGVIAPMIAERDARLAAIVLMAGTAKKGEDILRFQFNYAAEHNPKLSEEEKAKARAETEAFLRAIKENGDVSKYPPMLRPLNSPWGRAFMTYDPLPTMMKVRQPVLILQGALDQQVTADQAQMLEQAARKGGNKDVTVRIFPTLNHLFLPAKTGEEREYAKLETYELSNEFLSTLADWLQLKLKVGK